MAKIERSFVVGVPVETVFAYLADFRRIPEWLPRLTNVRGISGKGIDQVASWTYDMMNRSFRGELACAEHSLNERLVMKTTGNITSTWVWTFKAQPHSTSVRMVVEYKIPMRFADFIGAALALIENRQEADVAVATIKTKLESQGKVRFFE